MTEERPEQLEERILLLAPTARDAATSRDLLAAAEVRSFPCDTIEDVCREVGRGAGAAVVTAEAVLGDKDGRLAGLLHTQPPWSDFPLIVLTPPGAEAPQLLRALDAVGPMTLMKRPVQVSTLVSTVRSALRDRRRQYAVRDLLAQRRRAEKTLRAERERYRVTLGSIGDAVIATDTGARVTFLNPVAEQLTGWDSDAARGRPLDEVFRIVNETSRRPVPNPALRALAEGVVVGLANHTVLLARDGTERPLDDSAAPIRGAGGEIVGAVLVFRDITEKRRAETALRNSEGLLRLATDAAELGIWVWDVADDRVTWENDRACELFGLAQSAGAGNAARSMAEFVHPDDAGAFERAVAEAVRPGGRLYFLGRCRRPDGEVRWVEFNGGPVRAAGTAADVTERKRAEEALAREALLLANVHDAVVVTDLEGVVTYWNEGATRLFGWTAREMVGRSYADRFPEPVRSWTAGEIRSRAGGSEWSGEYEDYRKDGSRVWIDTRVTRVSDATGKMVGILGLSYDITERKNTEYALKEADRRKNDFIALLAHELRNPLAPLRNGLQVMRLAGGDADAVAQARAMMDRQLGHMVRLIDDLLDISRISCNKMELRRARVPLADVVGSAVEAARPLIEAAGHALTVSLPPEPVFLDADLTRLAQVFSNLLTNSAKYTDRGGRIWLGAESRNGTVTVSVRDNGIGIPAEALPSIFDMFSQVDRSIERSTGGLGIGLALVKGLVEMHGGTVAVESGGPGRGSTFTVVLPVQEGLSERPEVIPPDNRPAVRGPKRRMLVVDDNRDSAASMALMLELLGYEVVTAHDGIEAVEASDAFRPQVILMDVGMPRLNGLDATRRIREQPWGRDIVIIALTGWGQEGDRVRSREAGCDGHLVKPVSLPDLEKLLAELTGSESGRG